MFHEIQIEASEPPKIFVLESNTWGKTKFWKISLMVEYKANRREKSLFSGNTI